VLTRGTNPQFAALDRDGDLLVVNSGEFLAGNSTLVVLDPIARRLTAGPFALGDFGGVVAVGPDNRAFVTSFADGLYVFDATANRVLRSAANPLFAPDSVGRPRGSSGVAVDRRGNVLSVLFGDAVTPGKVFLFDAAEALVDSVSVGVGPFAVELEEEARPE
jgi:DNA-binding beta-propeller fold protein YncE